MTQLLYFDFRFTVMILTLETLLFS